MRKCRRTCERGEGGSWWGAAAPAGGVPSLDKMNTVNKKLDSLRSTDFTLLCQIKVSSVNNSDF